MLYQKLYLRLFNAITDAVEELECLNIGNAKEILMKAQQETEELYCEESPAGN